MMEQKLIHQMITQKKITQLCQALFQFTPTKKQKQIIETIAYAQHKRTVISCMTRYGKTHCVAAGTLLYALSHSNKRILLISPTYDQTNIIRNYIGNFIGGSEFYQLMLTYTGKEKQRREMSKRRLVLKNNTELIVLSAEGSGDRLMGFGGDLIILDESCLINGEVYRAKISRMLGDNPNSILIEIGNPWHRDNQMWDHWTDPTFYKIHVGYEIALEEGRISETFLEEQRNELTPLEFTVLYKSDFPEESEDSIFKLSRLVEATNKWRDFKKWRNVIIGADVADKGKDLTVIIRGRKTYNNEYKVDDIYSEPKSESTDVAGRIIKEKIKHTVDQINIDSIGIGVGVVSMVREGVQKFPCKVTEAHFGKRARDHRRFSNKKAEQYFRLQKLFEDGLISIPDHPKLVGELMSMRWEHTSSGKIKIIDPESKSPDFSDALVYFIWESGGGAFTIG